MNVFTDIIAYFSFVFVVVLLGTRELDITSWYNDARKRVSGLPPSWLFPIVWAVLYGLMIPVGVLYFQPGSTRTAYVVPAFALYVVNLILNIAWVRVFFGAGRFVLALVVLIVTILVSVAFLVLAGLDSQFVVLGLFLPYVLWLVVALYLNARIIRAKIAPPVRKRVRDVKEEIGLPVSGQVSSRKKIHIYSVDEPLLNNGTL